MSYILDALRRADAERQRGQVPGLDAQPALRPADSDAPRRLPIWGWIAVGVLLVAAAVVLWRVQLAAAPAIVPVAAAPAIVPVAAAPAIVPVAATPAPPPMAAAPATMPVVVSAPPALPAPMPAPLPVPAPEPAPAASAVPAPEPKPMPLAALSAEQRRELPPLVVGGSIWSDSPAQRFVIINGQVVHEGETAAPGVRVERIAPRAVVLRWRELRIELPL